QAAHLHRSLWHLGEELLHGLLHFDAKGWRTLPLLIGRPGLLTRRYIDGQRARYVSPLALGGRRSCAGARPGSARCDRVFRQELARWRMTHASSIERSAAHDQRAAHVLVATAAEHIAIEREVASLV